MYMPLFKKQAHELETQLDKWCFFLKNLETLDEIPDVLNEPIFQQGFKTAKLANMSRKDWLSYELSRLSFLEEEALVETAEHDGREKERILTVQNGLQNGFPLESLAVIVSMSLEELQQFIAKHDIKP